MWIRFRSLCNSISIVQTSSSNGQAVFTVRATRIGIALLEATATDTPGLSNKNNQVFYVYNSSGGISANAHYTDTTFDSNWLDVLEGCYVANYTFTVQFLSSHYNGDNTDTMVVTGKTVSGKEVELYRWTGNMEGNLHQSTVSTLVNNASDRIIQIRFYTYSPHVDCAREASITYSVNYTFDVNMLK